MTDFLLPDPPFSFDPSAFLNVGDDTFSNGFDATGADSGATGKRGRKVPDELTKARNRIYARVNRQKKKEYVEELEIRVRMLEADNCVLRQQLQDTLRANEALQQQLTFTGSPAAPAAPSPVTSVPQAGNLPGVASVMGMPQLPALPALTLPLLSPAAFAVCQPHSTGECGQPAGAFSQASGAQRPLGLFLFSVVSLFALYGLVPWHLPHRANAGPVLIHSSLAEARTTLTLTGRRLLQQADRAVVAPSHPALPFVEQTAESTEQRETAAAALVTVTPNLRIISSNATVLQPGSLPLLFLYVPVGFTTNMGSASRGPAPVETQAAAAAANPRQLLIGSRTTQNASKQVAEVRDTSGPEVLRRAPAPLLVDLVGCERAAQVRPDSFPHRQDTLRYIELLRRFERGEVALRSDIAEVIVRKVNEYCLMACRAPACSPKSASVQ